MYGRRINLETDYFSMIKLKCFSLNHGLLKSPLIKFDFHNKLIIFVIVLKYLYIVFLFYFSGPIARREGGMYDVFRGFLKKIFVVVILYGCNVFENFI